MKNSLYFIKFFLAINLICLLTIGAAAQGRHSGRGYGYSGSRYNSPRNYISINNNYRGYNNYRSYYNPYNNYYSRNQYWPSYRTPYIYSHFGPAFGFRINILPFGYSPFFIGNNPYYYYQGVYYSQYNNGGYQVIEPPLGAVIKHLPKGAKVTVINGDKYFELGGTFYQEETTVKNTLQYRVIGTNGVVNTSDQSPQEANTAPEDKINSNNYAPTNNTNPNALVTQEGQKINQLPANSKAILINKQKFYLTPNGVYYQEIIDANNNISYENVGGE